MSDPAIANFTIEKITADNYRPGTKHREGFLVYYRPHPDYGWTCRRSFATLSEAESFAKTLTPEGGLP